MAGSLLSHGALAQTCPATSTLPDQLGPFYEAGSPFTTRIGPANELSDPSKLLAVTGRVLLKRPGSCSAGVANINIEVWFAGTEDAEGNFYHDEYRGQLRTDAQGRFSFIQTFPTLYPIRPILHDHFRLSTAGGKELLVTQMYFLGTGEGFVADPDDFNTRVVEVKTASNGSRSATFNIYLNPGSCVARGNACELAGLSSCCSGSVCRRGSFPSGARKCLACRNNGRCDRHGDCCTGKRCLVNSNGVKVCRAPSA